MAEILLLYLTREGQTRRICECMAETLRVSGKEVEVLELDDERVSALLACCQQVVIGASIHYGHFPASLYSFIERHRARLDTLPTGFFGVNLTARKAGKDVPEGSAYMRTFLKKTTWRPQKLAVFPGALLYTRYTWYDRAVIRFIMGITGGPTDTSRHVEFTDWEKVKQFARSLL